MKSRDTAGKRVLAVIPSGFCYGLQNLTLSMLSRASKNVTIHFLNTRWTDGEFSRRVAKLGFDQSATWLGMFSRRLDGRDLVMTLKCLAMLPVAWWHFWQLYRQFRPDVIYLANHHEAILLFPLLLPLRRKVVCHIHDPPPAIAFQRFSFAIWRRAIGRFLFVSRSSQERLANLGPLRPSDQVIYNGVEVRPLVLPRRRTGLFVEQFGWPRDAIVVGQTGQMTMHKGHEDFLAAAALLAAERHELYFVIGGRPTEPMHSRIRKLVTSYGLDSRVALCGWLPSPSTFFDAIDIYVLPSRHEEGFGLVVAEAGERGVPVVCTRSGGAPEVVEDNVTGVLVNKGAVGAIAQAIRLLATDGGMRERFGVAARRRICENFDIEKQARRFEDLLFAEGTMAEPRLGSSTP
jgi:glycosyltransferase involved in cell wall biosynthesis